MDTGTAVTTMNDCNALILPSPMYKRIAATVPIISDQKTRKLILGSPSPVTAIEIEYAIESPVVTTNKIVNKRNAGPII